MPRPLPEKTLGVILDAIRAAPAGCAPAEIAARLNPKPPERNLQRWLAALVKQKRVVRAGGGKFTRYRMAGPNDVLGDLAPGVQPFVIRKGSAEAAIERLVTRPLEARMPTNYHRGWLDAYTPNRTWYLSDEIRALLKSGPGVEGGAEKLKDQAYVDLLVEDTVYSSLVFERENVTRETVKQFLAQPSSNKCRSRAMKLAWNVRDGFHYLAAAKSSPNGDLLLAVADFVDDGFYALTEEGEPAVPDALRTGAWVPRELGGVVRAPVAADSVYTPPAEPEVIRSCFEQITTKAEQVVDPFEASFFTLVHLLYLQPFTFSVSTACLAANMPLLHAKLLPTCFVTVPARVFRIAVLGVCELNQIDLLREVFVQTFFDGVELPKTHRYWR